MIDLTPLEWYYSTERLKGLLYSFIFAGIGIFVMFVAKYYNILNSSILNGLLWGLIGYIITLVYSLVEEQNKYGDNNIVTRFFNLLSHPINFILIGSIWIFIGTILASTYKLSTLAIILYAIIGQFLNHGIPV